MDRIRSSRGPARILLLLAFVAPALVACAQSRPSPTWDELRTAAEEGLARNFEDATPAGVPADALDAVVLLTDADVTFVASATVVGPHHLLTAAHVVDGIGRDDEGRLAVRIDGGPTRARVVASGDLETDHGDWALLEVEGHELAPIATLHAPALDPTWRPEPDTELLLVGYAVGFFPDRNIVTALPTPSIPVRVLPEVGEGSKRCWHARGESVHLGGMSGGAAMVWNADASRAEIVAVFSGYTFAEGTVSRTTALLGLPIRTERELVAEIAFEMHRLPDEALRAASLVPTR